MSFNHYAKLKRLLADQPDGWYIRKINQPTTATNFKGETIAYPYYYRLYDANDAPIKYGKFQQLERLSQTLEVDAASLPIIDDL